MVTKIEKPAALRAKRPSPRATRRPTWLFIAEWMAKRGLSDQTLGAALDVSRQTVYRWRTEQHRLDPGKQARIAKALQVEPEELWRPPGRQSIDAILKSATDDQVAGMAGFVELFMIKSGESSK
jgi:transcriptional regulator with XRE-family HTH domain